MFKNIKHFVREQIFSRVAISGDSFMYGLLAFLAILGPLFFIPVRAFPIVSSKGILVFVVVILGIITYGIQSLRSGTLLSPRQKIFGVLFLMMITGFLGSILSPGFWHALVGYGFETTTGIFSVLFGLTLFFSYLVVNSFERIGIIYGGLIGVFIIFVLTHLGRYILGPAFANMGVLGTPTSTLIGSWGDLGIFFGLVLLFCVVTLELAGLKKVIKWCVALLGIVAVIFLMVMNITIVWIVLGFAALLLALYLFSFAYWDNDTQHYKRSQRVPWFTMTLFIVSLVAIFFGGFFNSLASKHQNISWNDTRPSFEMTLRAAKKSIVHNVATGYGPNSFEGTWSLIKPVALSGGDSSRTGFSQGVGFIPTQMATNGILGIIAWVLFFVTLAGVFVRKIRAGFTHSLDRYFAIGMGISILYLSILAWVYIPGHYFLVLLAILVGAFIAIFDIHPHKPDRMISFIKDPRASFFGILGITMIIVLALFLGYIGIRKTASLIHYSKGIIALNQGKFSDANTQISFAAVYANHDIYRHQLAVFALNDVAQLVSKATTTTKDASSQQIEKSLGIALAHAQVATQINSMDYTNWVLLGDVYRSMVSLGVSDAYDRAYQAYEEAQKRNPNDSTMILHFAQLALAQKDRDGALELIKQSINKYPTADAYIARAQIQLGQQKNDSAEESLKAALALDPYNVDLAYQYGLLLLSQRRYTDAIPVLQRVVVMNRKYASAYVYLGYALERSGDTVTADRVYEYIKKEFPGGAEAITVVKNGQIDQSAPTVPSADLGTKDTSKLLPQKEVAPTPKK